MKLFWNCPLPQINCAFSPQVYTAAIATQVDAAGLIEYDTIDLQDADDYKYYLLQ